MAPDADDAVTLLARARADQHAAAMPFEEARTLLCEGETLRRARRGTDATVPLQRAREVFERLGARPWLERTDAELAAAGASSEQGPPVAGVAAALTPQELQIARAVASGLGNAETAAALFVSRKTVEAHLTHIYRKLHIRSRVQLARMLISEGLAD
jgi:DNA-binding NarL/FixJ family response regulator